MKISVDPRNLFRGSAQPARYDRDVPGSSPPVPRLAASAVRAALADTRVVALLGARQVGKSTLAEQIARERDGWETLSLDDQPTRALAQQDPAGLIASLRGPAVIDEVQRAPDLLLAIKRRVDIDQRPGQLLLTGSANILTAPRIADALTGRAEYVRLGPLTQAELLRRDTTFLDRLWSGDWAALDPQSVGRAAYAPAISAGGFPEALRRAPARRAAFFDAYVESLLTRDLGSIAAIHDASAVGRLLSSLAAMSSNELNVASLARDLRVPESTVRVHIDLLETLFVVRRIPPWSSNLLARTIKTPKVVVCDVGMMLALIGASGERFVRDLDLGGRLMETFVATELQRIIDLAPAAPSLFHFRDRNGREVDLVVEARDGRVAAIEVKSAASLSERDFRGLRHLQEKLGDRFEQGVVLYTGERALPWGDRLWGLPVAALWDGGAPAGAL